MKKLLLLFLSIALLLNSCSTDLDVNDEWRETMVVFGLLNQTDTAHYIKINKAFLGQANAFEMASVYDTVNYGNNIIVVINELNNGNVINSFPLTQDTSIAKAGGVFAYPKQVLFKLNQQLNDNYEYELVVTNSETGKQVKSKTILVKDFTTIQPSAIQTSVNFSLYNNDFNVRFNSAENGKLYNLIVRFYFREINKITNAVTDKYIDLNLGNQQSLNTSGGQEITYTFPQRTLYTFLSSKLNPDPTVWRRVGKSSNPDTQLDFIVTVAAEEFFTYMEVNSPSSITTLQDKPIYTNIENGIGLFSSRYKQNNAAYYNKKLTTQSLDSIYGGVFTKNLGFCDPGHSNPNYQCQ
jgi:hypothetical protein